MYLVLDKGRRAHERVYNTEIQKIHPVKYVMLGKVTGPECPAFHLIDE